MAEDTEHVLLSTRQDGVLWLTLNRPQRRNALSRELYAALLDSLQAAQSDDGIGAIVLSGAGEAFCAGGDVARMNAAAGDPAAGDPAAGGPAAGAPVPAESPQSRAAALRNRTRIVELLHEGDKLTVAMIRGPAVGAGLSLALACDLRYGDGSARLRTGFIDVGVSGDFGGHYFLPRIVGPARARELYLCSPMLDAARAESLGLLHAVYPAAELEQRVSEIAGKLARGAAPATALMKANLNLAEHAGLQQVLQAEAERHVRCVDSADHKAAVRAYAERRKTARERRGG
ncbi:enoyl-CoA hydratase-related protein [Bordetella genomosp. 13]|uniref:enoyl-CoA hydratase-related protein n=1 Tax=Bordetella genomosp. 13 TaxID=463040 RepID=UPI0011A0AA43|nr:enoyl-CoA hydratase-related protein [Bordetella genomosp. 13]